MDVVSQQLKAEIEALEKFIHRTEDRLQVAGWVSELLDPFERLEDRLSPAELQKVVRGVHQAKVRFGVNGELAERIDDILQRHSYLVDELVRRLRSSVLEIGKVT